MEISFQPITIRQKEARFLSVNESGIPAHFYAANSFPLGTYERFLTQLSSVYQLKCLSMRACWPANDQPPKQMNWEVYADDLIDFIEKNYNEPIIGIGHSQGATATIMAAVKRPDLFKALQLIEPGSVSRWISFLMKVIPYFIKATQQPLKSALIKKNHWETKEDFYDHFRQLNAFKRVSDDVLKTYTKHGLKPSQKGGYECVFSVDWEASNYAKPICTNDYIPQLNVPVTLIAGKPSLFFSSGLRDQWKELLPDIDLRVDKNYGHLFPLEAPEKCADLIIDGWQKMNHS